VLFTGCKALLKNNKNECVDVYRVTVIKEFTLNPLASLECSLFGLKHVQKYGE